MRGRTPSAQKSPEAKLGGGLERDEGRPSDNDRLVEFSQA
jgi:hypothetical protein